MGNKSQNNFVSFRGRAFRDKLPNGPLTPTSITSVHRQYSYVRTGSDNPNFRALIRRGVNATGTMVVTVTNGEATDCRALLTRRYSSTPGDPLNAVFQSGLEGVFLSLNNPSLITQHFAGVSFDKACVEAKRIVHKRLTARRRQFMGGVVAIELRKTLQMVVRPAKSLRSKFAFASRRIPRVMKLLNRPGVSKQTKKKALADTYLEMTFGWQPLLSDTRDGALALARLATKDALERQQFRAYGSEETPGTTTFGNNYLDGYDLNSAMVFHREWRQKTSAECIIYGKFRTRLQDSSYAKSSALRLAELAGFTFADFLPTAWEALPWSFLVDYFTNVGDVIEAFSNNIGEIAWAAEVHIQKSTEDFYTIPDSGATAARYGVLFDGFHAAQMHAHSTRKTVTRSPGVQTDLSQYLRFNLPGGIQWLNIGALAAGARPPKPFY